MSREDIFNALVEDVSTCTTCERMGCSKRVLNYGCGSLNAPIMVIGEAPGRLGADASGLPFHGDKAGQNFEDLIKLVGLNRADLFITNAVLCNPKDHRGNNAPPLSTEIVSCSRYLKRQIDLVDPLFVVTLGGVALKAVASIELHEITLRDAVRTAVSWYGRTLVPLYHPGQRAMIHRSFANQAADYQFLSELVRRGRQGKRKCAFQAARIDATLLAEAILSRLGTVSYFALHKLSFLAEVKFMERYGERMTGAYYVRQKDGPYCVDLHPARLKKAGLDISWRGGEKPYVTRSGGLLLALADAGGLSEKAQLVVDHVVDKYAGLPDDKLKTAVYLSAPMRQLLRREKAGIPQFNAPVFEAA